jgi:ABC-type dipeptide/oligopeptide/nickel transport system permease component
MTKFVIRRLLWTIPVLLLVILFTFVLMRQIKGNPFRKTERAVPASIQATSTASSTSTSPGTSSTRST